MKTYVLLVSRVYPITHPRKGFETNFPKLIKNQLKIHTIRGNYDLWRKRFDEIEKGLACLSLRYWTGKPYKSKQEEFLRLDASHGIGIEKLVFRDYLYDVSVNHTAVDVDDLAKNDGLSYSNFESWFCGYGLNDPMAIIHFTEFRYSRRVDTLIKATIELLDQIER